MTKRCLMLFLIISVSHGAIAQSKWFGGTIKRVYPLANGDFILIFNNDNPSCTNQNKYHYTRVGKNGVTKEGIQFLYSAALAAAASGKKVSINFDTSDKQCYVNRLQVTF